MSDQERDLDIDALRERLAMEHGPRFWRSLEELARSEAFRPFLEQEFPRLGALSGLPASRRDFLRLMGASLALAGAAGCTGQPSEDIVPYVRAPEELIPGKPLYFATAMPLGGYGYGVLVESHMGRPTKVEGNPDHPASLGATDIYGQASVLGLYDPDRSQAVLKQGQIDTWDGFVAALIAQRKAWQARQGEGLHILTETVTSPTLASQLDALLKALPQARWHQYDPMGRDNVLAGSRLAFGRPVEPIYRFDRARVILSLDADFLYTGPGRLRYARDFIDGRRVVSQRGAAGMNRLYVVECTPTITGAMADHRLAMRAQQVAACTRALAATVGVTGVTAPSLTAPIRDWLAALAADLKEAGGAALIVAGEYQPPQVHALAHAMNAALGAVSRTVSYIEPVEARPVDHLQSLRELVQEMAAGRVETLVVLEGNPVLTAPVDLTFAEHLSKVVLCIHLGLYRDETAERCNWHVPASHYLESWSDIRAFDGTVSLQQPLIAPLYGGRSAHEMLAALAGEPDRPGHNVLQEHWRQRRSGGDFDIFWRKSLRDGIVAGSVSAPAQVTLAADLTGRLAPVPHEAPDTLELVLRPDPTILDGRHANNAWLQECPKPVTKLTWDNAALMSPATAQRLRLQSEVRVDLAYRGHRLRLPVCIVPGHADGSVTIHLGYGRTRAGRVGNGTGFDAYPLRISSALWGGAGLSVEPAGGHYPLATTQHHQSMAGRDIVRAGTLAAFRRAPRSIAHGGEEQELATLYPIYPYSGYVWGMSIDINACIGCSACVVACQSENNVPVVGKNEVLRGHEMHWLRVDRYYQGSLDSPRTYFQPVPCMQCEKAPCEPVCPVEASVHDSEGINNQVYNRCIGTRFCSNNCPYKVRRFNWFDYGEPAAPVLKAVYNPDVTVRSRGVMEKCTYCIQRINEVRIEAEKEDRRIRPNEVMTACQQVCPTRAIVFGDLNDSASLVLQRKASPLDYTLLRELNTRPRTTYQARLMNPNPKIKA